MSATCNLGADTSVEGCDAALSVTAQVASWQQSAAHTEPAPKTADDSGSVRTSPRTRADAAGDSPSQSGSGLADGRRTVSPPAAAASSIAEGSVPFATVFYSLEGVVVKYNIVFRVSDRRWLVADRRYSDILSLHHILKKMHADTEKYQPTTSLKVTPPFPRFPGRGLVHARKGNRITFLLLRRRALDEYFRALTATTPCGTNVCLLSSESRDLLTRFCTPAPSLSSRGNACDSAASQDGERETWPMAFSDCFLDDGLDWDAVLSHPIADTASRKASEATTSLANTTEVVMPGTETSSTRAGSDFFDNNNNDGNKKNLTRRSRSGENATIRLGSVSFFSVPECLRVCQKAGWIEAAYGVKSQPLHLPCMSAIPTLAFSLPHAKMYFDHVNLKRLLVVLRSVGCESVRDVVRRRDELLAFYGVVAQQQEAGLLPSTLEARHFFNEYEKRHRSFGVRRPLRTIGDSQGKLLTSTTSSSFSVKKTPPFPSTVAAVFSPHKGRAHQVPLCSNSVHLVTVMGDVEKVEGAPDCCCTMNTFCIRQGSPCGPDARDTRATSNLVEEGSGLKGERDCSGSSPAYAPAQLHDMYKTASGYIIHVHPPAN